MVESWKPAAVNDERVHAHGGQILRENGFWYFIGEDRRGRSRVSIYRSRDFISWERRYTFTLDAVVDNSFPGRDTTLEGGACGRCNLERPKIIRSRRSGRYVMWMHFEYENDYREARLASAWADSVEGPYFYTGSFRPLGNMSRDLNVFTDDDGQAYIISTTDDNRTLNIYALDDDAMSVREKTASLFPSRYREAPVLFKKERECQRTGPIRSGTEGGQRRQHRAAHDKLVEHPPLAPIPVRAACFPCHQVIEHRRGNIRTRHFFRAQRFGNRRAGRIIVEVPHYNKVRIPADSRYRIRRLAQDTCRQQAVRRTLTRPARTGREMADKHIERIARNHTPAHVQDVARRLAPDLSGRNTDAFRTD